MSEKLDTVLKWIEKADHDLGTAQVTFLYLPGTRDTIAFHCQQAVEKYLKSYLLYLEIPFKRTHSLNYLLSLLSQHVEISEILFDRASGLEEFSVEIRYPDITIDLSDEDIQQAFDNVKHFRQFVLTSMNLSIDYHDLTKK